MSTPDRNFQSYADVTGRAISGLVFNPEAEQGDRRDWSDTLKLSHVTNFCAQHIYVNGGREDAVDIKRQCSDVLLSDFTVDAGDRYAATIKGGSQRVHLRRWIIRRPGKWCDIDLGNWSDQSTERSRQIILEDVGREDGRPVRVRVGRADRPEIIGGHCRVLFWQSLGLSAYWWAKYALRRWALRKQPPLSV